jgi:hypothetical protein
MPTTSLRGARYANSTVIWQDTDHRDGAARPSRIKYLVDSNHLPIQYRHIRHSPGPASNGGAALPTFGRGRIASRRPHRARYAR